MNQRPDSEEMDDAGSNSSTWYRLCMYMNAGDSKSCECSAEDKLRLIRPYILPYERNGQVVVCRRLSVRKRSMRLANA